MVNYICRQCLRRRVCGDAPATQERGRTPRVHPSPPAATLRLACAARRYLKYATPPSKSFWYLLPGTFLYRPLPERSV